MFYNNGGPGGSRTRDPRSANAMLWPAELQALVRFLVYILFNFMWNLELHV